MYEFLLRKWIEPDSEITIANIDYAVSQTWITQVEGDTIKATPRN